MAIEDKTVVVDGDKPLTTQGAAKENLNDGQTREGAPAAPVDNGNAVPPKKVKPEGMDEEHGETDPAKIAAAAAAKTAATEAAANAAAEAAGPLTEFITLDDPAGQAALNVLKEAGVGPNEANKYFAKAIKSGDITQVDWAGIEAKVGKDKATLIKAGVESYYGGLLQKQQATVKQTHDIFGGEQNWNGVRDWAHKAEKGNAVLKSQIDAVRSLLDQGGVAASAGARELLRLYNADPATTGLGVRKLVQGDSSGNVVGKALTRGEYVTELKAAHDRGAKQTEIAAIDARRRAGKQAGI